MSAHHELASINWEEPERTEVQPLRKASSLHCMEALRGRSLLPRTAVVDSSSPAASKLSRAASLGRRTSRRKSTKSGKSQPPRLNSNLNCGYRQPRIPAAADNNEPRAWAVGRLSMMLLLFVTFTDITFTVVNDQMSQIESHEDYDALSPDVIRPAFLYKSNINIDKPSLGLGSAAIASITDALMPILPFTGGVDLRRSEYYTSGNVFQNVYTLAERTYEAYANARLDKENTSDDDETPTKPKPVFLKKDKRKHKLTLGASDSFVSLDSIAELTLQDVGVVFEYVTLSTNEGFNPTRFQSKSLARVKKVLQAIDAAVAKSRGERVATKKVTANDSRFGSTDAFLFCAAMRVFAEWRVLRQVPEGYKGYAVGMSLGQKDVVQNVAKIERAAQAWIDSHSGLDGQPKSPSLRDVLQYEIDIEEHTNLPRLKESSGAMGLLWTRRQLDYQTFIFENILEVPRMYPSSKDAVSAAYNEVYGQYHGWAVQKIFTYSFQASPPVEEIYKFMNPHRLAEVKEIANGMTSSLDGEVNENESTVESPADPQAQPPENLFHRIGWETERFVQAFMQNLQKLGGDKMKKADIGKSTGRGLVGAQLEEFITLEMSKNVHEHIESYLEIVKPVLLDLAGLFSELNMDDPTKV